VASDNPSNLVLNEVAARALQRAEEMLMKQKGKSNPRCRPNRATMKNTGGV
jgi:hypothetical protein